MKNDRREYYKLYHQHRMNEPGYAGKIYIEKRREMAREYAKSHKKDARTIEKRDKYFKLYRAKNRERIREYNRNKDKSWNGTLIGRYSVLKAATKRSGLAVPISFEEYKNLMESPCYLCGDSIMLVSKSGHGIDRVDSSLGYILSNCRPCCGICNRMKRVLSVEDFIVRIKKILQNYNKK